MPRQSRLDFPGALHHIMARGIEKRPIFKDNTDRLNFLERLGKLLRSTQTLCFAWSLMPNHFHLLLKTGPTPISIFMRRLLTGHALWFNKRHERSGHLFQNRFKSVLCQEDNYFLELVRYIHLNPIRANLVKEFEQLSRYTFCGHGVLLGNMTNNWQDTSTVLAQFDRNINVAKHRYLEFVGKGISIGKRSDLTGGGLIRSAGGWTALTRMRKDKNYQKSDERILGDGDFVETILHTAQESLEKKYLLQSQGVSLNTVVEKVADIYGIAPEMVWASGRYRKVVEARSLMCYWSVRKLGIPMSSLARRLNISITAVSKSVVRGQKLAHEKNVSLIDTE
jgi:REP element-mobilizing transposase RayT